MTNPKEKPKPTLREPRPKKQLGLSIERRIPHLREPHEDLIKPETASLPSQTSQTSQSSQTRQTLEGPVAPERDFTRVANSINRDAIPAGLFKGKAKQLYDCLYLMTRGAVVPTRSIRISRPQLMKKAHIGSRVTFEANLSHLQTVGLVQVRHIIGEHEGNEYTILLPEETSMPSQTSLTGLTGYAQKLDRLVRLETSQTRHTLNVESTGTYDMPKTSFKTNTKDDDEDLAEFDEILRSAARRAVGGIVAGEGGRWAEVARLLASELELAASRTSTVNSAPAILAAQLRRRIASAEQRPTPKPSKTEPAPLAAEQIEPPTPEEVAEFESIRAEIEGK